jgi:hypothetical protein
MKDQDSDERSRFRMKDQVFECWLATLGSEGIAQIEEVEPAKVGVPRVERRHAVLQEDGCKMSIRNEIAANRAAGNRFVDREETLLLAECPRMRQRQETSHVGECFVR